MHGALGFPRLKRGLSYILSPVIGTTDDSWHRRSICPSVQNAPLAPIWPPAERAATARTIPPSACLSRNTRTDAANWQGLRKPMIPSPVGGLSVLEEIPAADQSSFRFRKVHSTSCRLDHSNQPSMSLSYDELESLRDSRQYRAMFPDHSARAMPFMSLPPHRLVDRYGREAFKISAGDGMLS